MKRILCVLLCLFSISGCEATKIITIPNAEYSCIVNISFCGEEYMYKLEKRTELKYTACGDTIPIDFCVSNDDTVTASYTNKIAEYPKALNRSHISLISKIINSSINSRVSPDYNGNYIIHGNCINTDYSLYLNEAGFPIKITSKNSNLIADFTNIKEVNDGS